MNATGENGIIIALGGGIGLEVAGLGNSSRKCGQNPRYEYSSCIVSRDRGQRLVRRQRSYGTPIAIDGRHYSIDSEMKGVQQVEAEQMRLFQPSALPPYLMAFQC